MSLKAGILVAISLGGVICYALFRRTTFKPCKSKEIEEEKAEIQTLKMINIELEEVKKNNEDLVQKLDYLHMIAASVAEEDEVIELKQENERLRKKVEKLQEDRSSDIEQLVYPQEEESEEFWPRRSFRIPQSYPSTPNSISSLISVITTNGDAQSH